MTYLNETSSPQVTNCNVKRSACITETPRSLVKVVVTMVKAKKWILAEAYSGDPKLSNFRMEEETLPDNPRNGEVLCEALYLSVDPYMTIFAGPVGDVAVGEQVARVIGSGHSDFPVGTIVSLMSGWRTHTLVKDVSQLTKVPDIGSLPLSLPLGILGMPGMTAYFGFLEGCSPKAGETVMVSTAAGAVGSVVGQIAKIKECYVIGSAGSDEKVKWMKEELGFDLVFNYKKEDVKEVLKSYGKGVDCYFDNVGGDFTYDVLTYMNKNGRVAVCGTMAEYTGSQKHDGKHPYNLILMKQLRVQGIMGWNHVQDWPKGIVQMREWIEQGKMKYRETITEGFENMCTAFVGLFTGANTGKAIVKA